MVSVPREAGQSLEECTFMLVLVAIAIIVIFVMISPFVSSIFAAVTGSI